LPFRKKGKKYRPKFNFKQFATKFLFFLQPSGGDGPFTLSSEKSEKNNPINPVNPV
jgi:hypothetical protein